MPDDGIELQRRGSVAWITLNRPDALNARNAAMRTAIAESLERCDADASVRVVALTGSGRAFSVGMDLKEAASDAAASLPGPVDVHRLAALRKPTIAAVNGFALGGGCELALACDLRIASSDARLGLPEVRRGLLPGAGGTQRLPRLIGMSAAAWLVLLGEPVSAEEAARLGLVHRVVAPQDLLPTVQTVAETIAKGAPLALEAAKQALAASLDGTFEAGLSAERDLTARLRATADFREGAAAFKEKRDPIWRGR